MTKLIEKIKELCNHPWKKGFLLCDKIRWDKLWSSIDVIEDTQLAIETYKSLPNFNANNGGYLYIYGIFQTLTLQQDAAINLSFSIIEKSINLKDDYPALYRIRETRNNSIGHPTKRGNNDSFHSISRPTISKENFTIASYFPKGGESTNFQIIEILDCIEIQSTFVSKILQQLLEKLEEDFEEHKLRFKGEKISKLIDKNFNYEFSKIYEHINHDYPLAEMNFNLIRNAYEKIKEKLIERYFSLNTLAEIKVNTDYLDYLFNRLEQTLFKNKISDSFELTVFIDALRTHLQGLQECLIEIDKEFE